MELFSTTSCQANVIEIMLDNAVEALDREGTPPRGAGNRTSEKVSCLVVRTVRDLAVKAGAPRQGRMPSRCPQWLLPAPEKAAMWGRASEVRTADLRRQSCPGPLQMGLPSLAICGGESWSSYRSPQPQPPYRELH